MELAVMPGEHRVALALDGYAEKSDVVRVERAGESVSLAFALRPVEAAVGPPDRPRRPIGPRAERATGILVIATVPTWSNVFLGARKLGVTLLRTALPTGHHRLTLRSDAHGSRTVEVDIREGETTRLRVQL
jgi:hypothetical protein